MAGKWIARSATSSVASTRPLGQSDPTALKALDEIRKPRPPARRKKERPAPGALSLKSRGLLLVGVKTKQLTARADSDGVAIFRFSFQHAK